ncbi:MAG: PH domain-containing protein [Candidatus Peribacteraceae bacterium]
MSDLNTLLFTRHLDDDEIITKIIHKHWILGIRFLFWPSVSFIVAWLVLYAVPFLAMFYVVALWATISLVWWLRNFFDYYLDAWIITNAGIIDVEWHGWFHRESTRVLYSDIQGVSYEIQGVLGTVLRYGTISVEKISTGNVVSLDHVSHPRSVESLIMKNMEKYLYSKNLKDSRHVQELLSQLVAGEVQLNDIRDDGDDDDDEEEFDED